MASALQKKSKPTVEAGKPAVTEQQPDRHPVTSDAAPFTAEQRQILGHVYRLILSWRGERLMKTTPQSVLNASSMSLTDREA